MSWVARIGNNIRSIRVVYCPKSVESRGTREFVENKYVQIKRLNPSTPFGLRPSKSVEPFILAEYDYGGKVRRDLAYMTEDEVNEQLRQLVQIGEIAMKANLYPWQQSHPKDTSIVDYDREDPAHHRA